MRPETVRQLVVVTMIAIIANCCPHGFASTNTPLSKATHDRRLKLYTSRQKDTDLEVTGLIAGLPAGAVGYVAYADLLRLPQVTFQIHRDEDFSELKPEQTLRISGVYLQDVAKALEVEHASDLIDASCVDSYRAHYPGSYISAHHPVLALTIEHLSTAAWAGKVGRSSPGPYFISNAHFVPSFKVLSHEDQAQLPINVVRLNFATAAATFGSIRPRGDFAPNSPQQIGFTIAKQNCLRCHNQGPYGGGKSGRNWLALSTWASEQPTYFANYVRDPHTYDEKSKMPGNPDYDPATLGAITAYFQTFANPVSSTGR